MLDGIEAVIYGGVALVVFVGLLAFGVRAATRVGGMAGQFAAVVTLALVVGVLVRDVLRRRWSPISIVALTLYLLCLGGVILLDASSAGTP